MPDRTLRAYLAVNYHSDHRNRPLVERITVAFDRQGINTFCVARDVENWGRIRLTSQELMREALGAIRSSDIVVVEASEKGVGLGIEAGYAHAYRIPVVVLHPAGLEVSNTLRGIAGELIPYEPDTGFGGAAKQIADFVS